MRKLPAFGLVLAVLLSACNSGLSGTYRSRGGELSFDFTSGDTVDVTVMGQTFEGHYRVEDRKVYIDANGKNQIFPITRDGCLDLGPMFGKGCKV